MKKFKKPKRAKKISTLLLEYTKELVDVNKEINQTFFWYNVEEQKMETFHGGRLIFENLKPKVVPVSVVVKEPRLNAKKIDQWMNDIGRKLGAYVHEIDSNGLVIEFEETMSEQIEYLLDRHGIRYSKP